LFGAQADVLPLDVGFDGVTKRRKILQNRVANAWIFEESDKM
jgi:hypothetical protein